MKKLLILFFVFSNVILYAQDNILQTNGEEIQAKVIEITPDMIKYKKYTNQDGPVYSIYKKDVQTIVFEDGSTETFNIKPVAKKPEKKESVFTDPRDNQKYKTVIIGDQVWMAENLNFESNQSWCYDNTSTNCEKYGRLYTYEAANNVCPDGWHLPADEEWKELEIKLGMQNVVNETGWRGTSPGQGRLMKIGSSSGFNAELVGFRNYGGYENLNDNAYFWTSTFTEGKKAFSRELSSRASVKREETDINLGYSVRCVEGNANKENKDIPKDEKKDKLMSGHENSYFSVGIGSGTAYGLGGVKIQGKLGNGILGVGVHYAFGIISQETGYGRNVDGYMALGTKFYYRYYFLNVQLCNFYDEDPNFAILAGMEYPLSKSFNLTGGLGISLSDSPLAWEIGINYKIFK
jgi:uncharacterized protein (TIGR02145 family)